MPRAVPRRGSAFSCGDCDMDMRLSRRGVSGELIAASADGDATVPRRLGEVATPGPPIAAALGDSRPPTDATVSRRLLGEPGVGGAIPAASILASLAALSWSCRSFSSNLHSNGGHRQESEEEAEIDGRQASASSECEW